MYLKNIIRHKVYKTSLSKIDISNSCVINTINAHSFCLAKKDKKFATALKSSDILLPDGSSMVLAARVLERSKIKKIAGADVHRYLLQQANVTSEKVFYLGASKNTLNQIKDKIKKEFPNIQVQSYSPPYKPVFDAADTAAMIHAVNAFEPKILFIGMTAPKQEIWVLENKDQLKTKINCSVGAVFDFYAGNIKRAPEWMINMGMEWLYRLIQEPKRMWKRYLINNTIFIFYLFQEYINNSSPRLRKKMSNPGIL